MNKLLLFFYLITSSVFGQVGIGTDNPETSAKLDVSSNNKGFLPPRVSLISTTNNSSPIDSPVAGLIVYNLATSNDVTPGYYYWNGVNWVSVIGATTSSNITGNGTTTTLSNFSSVVKNLPDADYTLQNSDNGKVIV